jgi:hypothetical protein
LAIAALSIAAAALALALPAFASASLVALEVQKEGGGGGTVTSLSGGIDCGGVCAAELEEGEEVTLSATPDSGSEFLEWEGCDSEPAGDCKVTMDKPRTVTAVFEEAEPPGYSLTIEGSGNGEGEWVCLVGGEEGFCEEEYPEGTHVTIKAGSLYAYEGSKFSGFGGDCASSTGSMCNLIMEKDHAVTVIFNLKEFPVTVKKNGEAGSGRVECELEEGLEPCRSKYPWGTDVVFVAIAEPGYEFVKWEGCDKEPEPGSCEVEVDAEEARSVTVTFSKEPPLPSYALKVEKDGTGSGAVTSSPAGINCGATCSAKFEEGKEVILTASPSGGSEFVSWAGACVGSGACKVTMSAAREVTATFDSKPAPRYTLTVKREGSGSGAVTSDPAGIECGTDCGEDYPEGTMVTLTATPAAGSVFRRWSGVEGGCALEPVCRTKMGGSKVVKALFDDAVPAPKGSAKVVGGIALVRGGRAMLELRCAGGPCEGGLRLIATLRAGKRKSLVIGKRSFSLASGDRSTVKIKLSRPARRELAKRGRLAARVMGAGVLRTTVKLKSAKAGR